MPRLHSELQRLYGLALSAAAPEAATAPMLVRVDTAEGLRVMVLTLGRPADWPRLEAVWQAVQAELDLPAPAIAVNGIDGLQLWFALAQPVPAAQAAGFLAALCRRFLADVPDQRLQAVPAGDDAEPIALQVPGGPVQPEQWSAFVAPDLAPMFAETPWLDLPPPQEGQAELLSRLQPASADAFARACVRLQPVAAAAAPAPLGEATGRAAEAGTRAAAQQFLLRVMNDEQLAMPLRIEAAKALLGQAGGTENPTQKNF